MYFSLFNYSIFLHLENMRHHHSKFIRLQSNSRWLIFLSMCSSIMFEYKCWVDEFRTYRFLIQQQFFHISCILAPVPAFIRRRESLLLPVNDLFRQECPPLLFATHFSHRRYSCTNFFYPGNSFSSILFIFSRLPSLCLTGIFCAKFTRSLSRKGKRSSSPCAIESLSPTKNSPGKKVLISK